MYLFLKIHNKSTACYQWLTDNGLGDIIKNQVGISFWYGGKKTSRKITRLYKRDNLGIFPK